MCDGVGIVHQITNAANGSRDAVMYFFTKKNDMFVRLETGATPLAPKEKHRAHYTHCITENACYEDTRIYSERIS